jgi:hypothetical protein
MSRGRDDGTAHEDADRLMLSTPYDYLEKIFNVPFVLPAMTPPGFDTMIRRLSITKTDSHDAAPDGERQAPDGYDARRASRTEPPGVAQRRDPA